MSLDIQTSNKPKGGFVTVVVQIVFLVAFIAAGWFLRGLLSGGGPGGAPGGPGGSAAAASVITAVVEKGAAQAPQEFVGRVEAIQSVDIKAQISGYIAQVHFAEGSLVREGDRLFTIEREPYIARVAFSEAALEQAKADLIGAKADIVASQAALDSAKADLDRAEKYLKRLQTADKRSIVQANLDVAVSDEKQARSKVTELKARLEQAKSSIKQIEALIHKTTAELNLAKIDLGYTEIHSPITGRIGEALLTKGNYVSPGMGVLAHLVQVDPIRVVFSMSDRQYVSVMQDDRANPWEAIVTRLRLPNGKRYDALGKRDFDGNQMNPKTGTLPIRVRFGNPKGLLVPQSYITVILEQKETEKVPVVPQESVITEGGSDFVYVVDVSGAVEKRKVVLGAKIEDYQCVTSGLREGEQIILEGLQKVRPGQKVDASPAPVKGDA